MLQEVIPYQGTVPSRSELALFEDALLKAIRAKVLMPLVLLSPSQASKAPRSRSSQETHWCWPKKAESLQGLVLGPSRGKAGVELPEVRSILPECG